MDARGPDALLARLADRGTLWLMHVNADPDCVASAFALSEAFGGVVGATGGMNRTGARLAQSLALEVDVLPHPQNHANVVAVDTGSRSGLGTIGPQLGDPLLVDHHRYGDLHERAPAAAWDPARASCAEVVLALLDRAGRAPSPEAARGLLIGLLTDTARFRFADTPALTAAARLVEMSGAKLENVLDWLSQDDDETDAPDERWACLVASQRAELSRTGSHIVATSHIGSYDGAAAGAIVRAGADVAVVWTERADAARLSMRASARARAAGLHLGEIANASARDVAGWSGGGHEGAAGMRGVPPAAGAREAVLRRVRETLGGRA